MNTLILALALTTPTAEPQFVVSNKCTKQQSFVVVNKVAAKDTTRSIVRSVPSDYHSHTCVNGHTWSHSSSDPNASHNCPQCGAFQNRVDPGSMGRGSVQSYQSLFTSGGCVNGNCAMPQQSTSRSGWYLGKLLGR